MLTKTDFQALLERRRVLILDGALATELDDRGHDLNHALWSAKLLTEDPASVEAVHLDYFLAGADVAITASYQASTQGLSQHCGLSEESGKNLIRKSVELAKQARNSASARDEDAEKYLLVAGSVGPYGAYLADGSEYRGDYIRAIEELQDFHRPRIQALCDAGADLLALETMPNLIEIQALLALLQDEFPESIAWVSCTSRDTRHMSDGTPWENVLETIHAHADQIIAFGVNCVAYDGVTDTLRYIQSRTHLPLVCYPNSGELWDATSKTWSGTRPDEQPSDAARSIQSSAKAWIEAGARLIGGCCRTGPAFVAAIHALPEVRKAT